MVRHLVCLPVKKERAEGELSVWGRGSLGRITLYACREELRACGSTWAV